MTCTKELLDVMARLRNPETGCPWDLKQDFASIAPYTIEEAYEVADAIERNDLDDLRGELGDLLFQVVFHARLAEEKGAFAYGDVVADIVNKMVTRHPHVFESDSSQARGRAWEPLEWERRKLAERAGGDSVLDGISTSLPELARAAKIQKRAAAVGFDWPDVDGVFDKIHEELAELQQARAAGEGTERIAEELGDLFFACVNLSRHLGVDSGRALRSASAKFGRRFRQLERNVRDCGDSLTDLDLETLENEWRKVKSRENDE
ncbi:MAG: nucleoside triphosphate pyrophosphohydrolase [Gammaproteobacteria bacterium]|nr:MAG: nucleoside triphosphate pyrophosphohydrolase [Gammaproteobacteria bacterium]